MMHDLQGYTPRTFRDLKHYFQDFSGPRVIVQDFPGHGIFKKKSRTWETWEPWTHRH